MALKIPNRASHCTHNKEPFESGMEYISLLESDDEQYSRRDFCLKCWNEIEKIPGQGSHWRGVIPEKKGREKVLTKDQKALQLLLDQLQDSNGDPCLTYIVALYLERRRQLAWRREIHPKQRDVRYFEVLENGEVIAVPYAEIPPHRLAELQGQLLELLQ